MFFIGGITQGTKELVYNAAAMICGRCGRYGRYQVFMTYMCLSFFFIPIFKWGRKYYVKTSCCGTVYQLNEEVGKRIAAGEDVSIREEDLTLVSEGHDASAWDVPLKRCLVGSEMCIRDREEKHPKIHYILAFDIWSKRVPESCKGKTEFLNPGQILDDGTLKVEGFKSTDEGVAFWCRVDGLGIYHAGD